MHSSGVVAAAGGLDPVISEVTITCGTNTQISKTTRIGYSESVYASGSIDVDSYEIGSGDIIDTNGLLYNSTNSSEFIDSFSSLSSQATLIISFVKSGSLPSVTEENYFKTIRFENQTTGVTRVRPFSSFTTGTPATISGVSFVQFTVTFDLGWANNDVVKIILRRD